MSRKFTYCKEHNISTLSSKGKIYCLLLSNKTKKGKRYTWLEYYLTYLKVIVHNFEFKKLIDIAP